MQVHSLACLSKGDIVLEGDFMLISKMLKMVFDNDFRLQVKVQVGICIVSRIIVDEMEDEVSVAENGAFSWRYLKLSKETRVSIVNIQSD